VDLEIIGELPNATLAWCKKHRIVCVKCDAVQSKRNAIPNLHDFFVENDGRSNKLDSLGW